MLQKTHICFLDQFFYHLFFFCHFLAGAAKVTPGQEVELAIGYNGGHQSATLNYFYVRYACGAATANKANFNKGCNGNTCTELTANQITAVDDQPATTNNYPVDATQSRRLG